ncbi:MAG TPA: hypothetical protein VHL59_10290 [Thermoanaerobaculia bacterium]|nr:hypothetical protein [Thermoanaerobaculia bacterium]
MAETNLDLRYDQVCVVGAHNAYTGYFNALGGLNVARNQNLTIAEQLQQGVRLLQLDLYRDEEGGHFYSKHGSWIFETVALSVSLADVYTFLTSTDTSAIVSIGFEPHVSMEDEGTMRALLEEFAAAGLRDLLFDPSQWPFDQFQRWPTLRQMIEKSWRLVLFSQNRVSTAEPDFGRVLYQYDYMVENVYADSYKPPDWTKARDESLAISATARGLFLMNHFTNFSITESHAEVNDAQGITRQIEEMRELYFRTPNFINVNFFDEGAHGGPANAAAQFSPAVRLLENINLAKRFEMTGNIFLEVKGKDDKQTMVAQLMDDYKTVTIQPKSDHAGQRWTPIQVQGSAVGIAFIHIDKDGRMYALSGQAKNADVTVVPFTPGSIPDSIIWKNCERSNSSEFRAIQYGRNSDYNLNVRGSVKSGNKIATWTWSGGDDNERWRFILVP